MLVCDALLSRSLLLILCLFMLLWMSASDLLAQGAYQKAPAAIRDILDAEPPPQTSLSPTRQHLLLVRTQRYPPIGELAEPMLRLAGLRINPSTNGPHNPGHVSGFTLLTLADGKQQELKLPAAGQIGFPAWSPDGKYFAFTVTRPDAIELWLGDVAAEKVQRLGNVVLNAAYGAAFNWMPGSRELLCQIVPPQRGGPPKAPRAPSGPVIQESSGKLSPVRTFQDLLQSSHDEDLFDFYATSQLVFVDIDTGKATPLGVPAVFASGLPSPEGKHVLVVRNHRPYSYLHPASAFPKEVEIWDREGKVVQRVASLPLADQVPIDGVPTGPRNVHWLATQPCTVIWVEARDGGDPKKKVPHRDEVMTLELPGGQPKSFALVEHRFMGLTWGNPGTIALLQDYDRDRKRRRTFLIEVTHREQQPKLLWDRSINDRYNDPGDPLLRTLPNGQRLLRHEGYQIFLAGAGATPRGNRPFLHRYDLKTGKEEELFRCAEGCYESVVALLSDDGSRFLTHHETPTDPPNLFVRKGGERQALTHYSDPCPQLRGIKKQLVTYKRADGVGLSMTLYLPADYKKGQRLPAVLWAYPLEFNDADTAGQVSGSPYRFTTLGGISHLFFLTQGYAVLDGATMPVVGDPEKVNDTYIEQIVSSARAAIDKADEMGAIDRHRVGVGGHSYGAFMTANLLAHSDLFRAGIARSGAYNRTLTPFGFQSERRTLWEAPDTYLKMSPFLHAHKIKSPLLLIHGAADNNPGTFPIQSERLYQAIKGNGGTVRFVSLPHESHGYVARESVEHTLSEMVAWFDRYVKNAPIITPRNP